MLIRTIRWRKDGWNVWVWGLELNTWISENQNPKGQFKSCKEDKDIYIILLNKLFWKILFEINSKGYDYLKFSQKLLDLMGWPLTRNISNFCSTKWYWSFILERKNHITSIARNYYDKINWTINESLFNWAPCQIREANRGLDWQ